MLLELTDEQEFIINEAVNWYLNSSSNLFQFTGPAGTGKSVVLNSIVARLGLTIDEIAPMSYIGASAIVMRRKGLYNARTIHSWLYNPIEKAKTDINGNVDIDILKDDKKIYITENLVDSFTLQDKYKDYHMVVITL